MILHFLRMKPMTLRTFVHFNKFTVKQSQSVYNLTRSTRGIITKGNTPLSITNYQNLRYLRTEMARSGNVPKVKFKKSDIVRLLSLAKAEKWVLLAAMGCLIVSSAITMTVPFALGKVIDVIFSNENSSEKTMEQLKSLSAILFGIFLLGGLANAARVFLFNSSSNLQNFNVFVFVSVKHSHDFSFENSTKFTCKSL